MAKSARVALIYPFLSTFIERDRDILSKDFGVNSVEYQGRKDFPRLAKSVLSSDLSFSWFALNHAHFAVQISKILRRKSVVVTGGWDVVSMPELGYGEMRDPNRARRTTLTLKTADKVLAVSRSNMEDVLRWVDDIDVEVIYHGFDADEFSPLGEKDSLVLSVAGISRQTLKVKGLETFIETSRRLKDVKFVLVGRNLDGTVNLLKKTAPSNLSIIDYLPKRTLIEYYRRAKVYTQLSAQESFGCAVAEAMLCECVPVVTDRGALPEVCGDSAIYVTYDDVEGTTCAIEKALESGLGTRARARIAREFPLRRREERLNGVLRQLLDAK